MDFQRIAEGIANHDQTFALLNRGYEPHQRSAGQWFETAPEMWDYFLCVLPPQHFDGTAFVMSEAATDTLSEAWFMVGKRTFCLTVRHSNQMVFQETVAAFRAHLTQEQAA